MKVFYLPITFFGLMQFFSSSLETTSFPNFPTQNIVVKDSLPNCAQKEIYDNWLNENPAFRQKQNQQEAARKIRLQNRNSVARRSVPYELPVVVHVIHENGPENIPDAQIEQGIQFLNDGFSSTGGYTGAGGADVEVQFKLAQRDPDGNLTSGINRVESPLTDLFILQDQLLKDLSRWDPTCYINIWLVKEICSFSGCGVAGFAYLPTAHGLDIDGIVMESQFVGTNLKDAVVLNHEMGHYLGLYHTFEGGCKNDDCLVDGDRVCDTPPDQSTVRANCTIGANSCSTDVNTSDPNNPFTTDQNDQMENFMDYSSCAVLFTEGQKIRMIDALENERFSLIKPDGCAALCDQPISADFTASATEIFAGETVTFIDNSIGAVTSSWTIDGIPFAGNAYTFNDNGTFNVQLSVVGNDPACFDKTNVLITVRCQVQADFTTPTIEIETNEILTFTNTSTAADTYEWSVNGSPISNDADLNFSRTSTGIYRVCLTAKNAFCESKKCVRILVKQGGGTPPTGSGNEDCTNSIDDDGDGLIDFYDPDCPCIQNPVCGDPFFSTCTDNCNTATPADSFPVKKTILPIDVDFRGFIGAADIDGDCNTDIIAMTEAREIVVGNENGVKATFSNTTYSMGSFGLADVDNDGMAEIFASADVVGAGTINIIRLDWDQGINGLVETWRSPPIRRYDAIFSTTALFPRLADFNEDGRPEVYSGSQIFDSQTGIELTFSFMNTGEVPREPDLTKVYDTAIAAELLPDNSCPTCEGLEIAAGNQVYTVDIKSYTDPSQNSMTVVRELPGFRDGATAVADFDLDGDLDVIVTNRDGITADGLVYVWDGQTPSLIGQPLDFTIPSPIFFSTRKLSSGVPSVGDVDGDSKPEIVLHCSDILVLEDYQTGGAQNWGTDPTQTIRSTFSTEDHLGTTTLFDFDLDGKCEIVTMNNRKGLTIHNENLDIIGGDQGTISSTGWQAPIVVDYDNDGEAEILIQAHINGRFGPILNDTKVHIFDSNDAPWSNTRKIFTQHNHHNTHINDDGTIPANRQNQSLVGSVQLNSFNQQYAIPKIEDCPQPENCNNGIDDDGDGLVDFYDPDCICVQDLSCTAPYYQTCTDNCLSDSPFSDFSFTKKATDVPVFWTSMMAAADVDGDCVTEILFKGNTLDLVAVDGISHDIKYSVDDGEIGNFATGDVDNDGMAEIFAIRSVGQRQFAIARYDFDQSINNLVVTWISNDNIRETPNSPNDQIIRSNPSMADFNQDGVPEIFIGNQIFDSQTGKELAYAGANFNVGTITEINRLGGGVHHSSVAFDMLPDNACPDCSGLELVAGNQIFSVNIQSTDPAQNSINLERELPGFGDGVTSIADFDTDGDADVIICEMTKGSPNQTKVYIWDGQNTALIGQPVVFDSESRLVFVSVPAIGDLDADGQPEIVINDSNLHILKDYDEGGGTNWGSSYDAVLQDSIDTKDHAVGVVLFDFNLDGKQEIIIRNQHIGLNIYDANLNVLASDPTETASYNEYPLVVDIDGDDQAELITYFCPDFSGFFDFYCGRLTIFESVAGNWANTRKIWNQYSFFNTNINEDGSIPRNQQQGHLVTPALNSFNQQYAIPESDIDCTEEICDNNIDDDGDGLIDENCPCAFAESFAKIKSANCGTNGIEVEFEICNDGDTNLPAETPITIYGGNPTQIDAPIKLTFELPDILPFGECFLLKKTITAGQDSLFIVLNDDGTLPRPFDLETQFPTTNIEECDYLNNLSGAAIQFGNPPLLDLGDDRLICDNGIFELVTNDGFESYRWSDGSFERRTTVFEPGTYWVDATDICGNVVTDTIVIEIDPITEVKLGTDLTVCEGDTVRFDAGIFDDYKWLPKPNAACDTCQIFELEISQDTQIIVQVASDLGCFSLDTVDVFVSLPVIRFDSIFLCRGDTISVNGTPIFSDTLLSQNINSLSSCDSIVNTKIILRDTVFKNEKIEICAGDTALVFGNPITSDTILTQIFNRPNACDSTQRVEITFKNQLFTEDEFQYCEGDTVLIFGIQVIENDTLTKIFTSAIGCDSTSEIRVIFTNSIQTKEDLDLCAGDTIMIFGNTIMSDTILLETFNSTNGCDSTHEVRVRYRPQISGSEILTFCEGDTVLIFGNTVTQSDTISETLTATSGCDSLATVEVIFNEKIETDEALTLCEGDTARFFGLEILSDSTISETIQSLNGCDSTHTVEIIFNQKIETFQQREFCTGDTAFLFGNVLTADDTVFQVFTSALGCDSTHNIDVVFLAEAEKMIFDSLCNGDFLLFFNDTISETGTYFQTIPSIDGCDTNYVLTAEFFEDPIVELISDTLISIGESFEIPLNISDSTLQVIWQPNENLSCENCSNPTVLINQNESFEAMITNAQGCSVIARINIRVADDDGIYIPSAFSPNGDFNNDIFTIFSKVPKQIDQLQIFDRWGGILFELNDFEGNDTTIGWDGTSRGIPVVGGVYVYKFIFKNDEGKTEMEAGDVTVLR